MKKIISNKTSQQENTNSNSIISTNSADLLSSTREIRDQSYFSRKNNLIAEFAYTPIPIYRSPQDKEPIGWLGANGSIVKNKEFAGEPKIERYRGYIIQYFNDIELANNKIYIDYRLHNSLSMSSWLTEEEFQHLKEVNQLGEELLKDDIALLKNMHKPNLPEEKVSTTYTVGVDPYMQIKAKEQVKQIQDMENKLKSKLGMPIDSEDQAEIENETDIKDIMIRAVEKQKESSLEDMKIKDTKIEGEHYSTEKEKEPKINNIP